MNFSDIKVSTKTIIAYSNLKIDVEKFYKYTPISNYTVIPKKRGRKCKNSNEEYNKEVKVGSIICVRDKVNHRGVILKVKKKSSGSYFLNSLTVVVVISDKKIINLKVSSNGKFQITGCKSDDHYIQGVRYVIKAMKDTELLTGEKIYEVNTKYGYTEPMVLFNVVMNNIDFKLGFSIHREYFDTFINKHTEFKSFFDASVGTGVNCKIKNENIYDELLDQIVYKDDGTEVITKVESKELLKFLEEKQLKKELKKEKYHTFLVFSTSAVIYSGSGKDMKKVFQYFLDTVTNNRSKFEEKCITE